MLELFRSPRRAVVWFVEASLLALLVMCAAGVRLGWSNAVAGEHFLKAIAISVVAQGSLYYHGLYGPEARRPSAMFFTTLRALGVAAALLWATFYLLPSAQIAEGVFMVALAAAALVLPAWRTAFERVSNSDSFSRPTIVLGAGQLAHACVELIQKESHLGLRFSGVLVRDPEEEARERDVIGLYADLKRVVRERRVGQIIVAYSDRRGSLPVQELLDLKFSGVDIEEGIDFYERVTGKIYVRELKPSQLIFAHGFQIRRGTLLVKRGFDACCAALGLLLATPLMLLTAIAIKLDSPGPILYSQIRAGAFGREFRIFKFRSMRTDAEKNGAVWAQEDDPRVTRVGSFIRKTRLDELPQLWNVLVGDMSMVGPRPERPVFIEKLNHEIPFFRQRLYVKPGLTGHAQVRCRYGASTEDALEKLQYDLFYIKTFSVWFDLSILIDTVKVVLLRIGAR
jgi:sugar transferase (PEP-CTERM system associated)